jgi:hypothetical protein
VSPEPLDPRALRWVEAGVSGLARSRDWDAVELVELPELADHELEELRFGVLADGTVVGGDAALVPRSVVERLAAVLTQAVGTPYEAVAARQTRLEWSLAARALRIAEIELPPVDAVELVVAVAPDGSRSVLVDGVEPADAPAGLDAAVQRLEHLGRRRFEHFVARARRTVGDRWGLSVDPL